MDPGSYLLGNYKINIVTKLCVQKPINYRPALGLEYEAGSLCQNDPPRCQSGQILNDFREQSCSLSKKAVVTKVALTLQM